jgi:hypothetical protein
LASAVQQSKYLPPDAPNQAQIRLRRAGTSGAVELRLMALFSTDLAQEADDRPESLPCRCHHAKHLEIRVA